MIQYHESLTYVVPTDDSRKKIESDIRFLALGNLVATWKTNLV